MRLRGGRVNENDKLDQIHMDLRLHDQRTELMDTRLADVLEKLETNSDRLATAVEKLAGNGNGTAINLKLTPLALVKVIVLLGLLAIALGFGQEGAHRVLELFQL